MAKVTIEINGREVSEAEAKQMIYDTFLAAKIEQVRKAVGDLPVELTFHGDLHDLRLRVKDCPADLEPELRVEGVNP
jgi:hypothetical protein